MTELPAEGSFFGTEARGFRKETYLGRGDTSVWTDTPAQREAKLLKQQENLEKGLPPKSATPTAENYQLTQRDMAMMKEAEELAVSE